MKNIIISTVVDSCNYEEGVKRECIVFPKTPNAYRAIPSIGEAKEMFFMQKRKQEQLNKTLGKRWRAPAEFGDLVFVTTMGSTCTRYIVEKEIKKVIKRIREAQVVKAMLDNTFPKQIRDFHPHTIRHTFCTRCFEKEMNPKVVQKLMGHSSISTTLNIYTHVLEEKQMAEIEKFGKAKTEDLPKEVVVVPKITAHSNY